MPCAWGDASSYMDKKDKKRIVTIIKFALLLAFIIGVPLIMYLYYRDTLFNSDWLLNDLPAMLEENKRNSLIVILGLQILQVIICIIPGQPIQFTVSYLFGIVVGYLISIVGALIGTAIAFYIAKFLGKDVLEIFFNEDQIRNYQDKLSSGRGLTIVLLIYLIPGLPKDLLGYVAGISDMDIGLFLFVSTIGRTPPMLASLAFGYFVRQENYVAVAILSVICVIVLIVCLIYRKKIVAKLDRYAEKGRKKHA